MRKQVNFSHKAVKTHIRKPLLAWPLILPAVFQELDESGAEVFTLLLPSGTPLPARRHCVLSGDGKLSSVCMNIYQKLLSEQPQQLAKVQRNQR